MIGNPHPRLGLLNSGFTLRLGAFYQMGAKCTTLILIFNIHQLWVGVGENGMTNAVQTPSPRLAQGPILNVSFYRFVTLGKDGPASLEALRDRLKSKAIESGLHGSILLSHEGINGFLAAEPEKLRPYLDWLFTEFPEFKGIEPKESFSSSVPFTRMLVKVKKEIITMGRPEIRPSEKTGKRIYPEELKRWYDEKKDFVIVDTRNDYEIAEGTFKNAVHYDIETFKQFPEKLEKNREELKDKPVVMFCTGGIRCEKATALAMDLGIEDVYQLEGGILKYFEEVGNAHYRGECFVFDHRTNVDPGLEARPDRVLREKQEGVKLWLEKDHPESARVFYALKAKGLNVETEFVETDSEALKALNPHGEAPVWVIGELTLYPANSILAYLDENYPETLNLTPDSAERRARMRLWLDWVDRVFMPKAERWIRERGSLSAEEAYALEASLEKDLYRLKTPLQRSRRFLVVDQPTQADFAAFAALERLRSTGFPSDYPERFTPVWEWADRVHSLIES
jgi:UPF0176 protein